MPQGDLKKAISDKNLRLSKVNIPHAKNATWPIEKKIEAVTTWLALGSLKQTAAVIGVSHGMVKNWKLTTWWKELQDEIIASRRIVQGNKLSKIVDKSLDVIDDRLENGDFIYNSKSGEVHRKPVALRDATSAANALMQRAAIIEKMNRDEQVAETTITIQEQLANLALEFAKFNKRDNSKAVTIEYKEIDDALYEERETRLQEGSEALYEQAGSGEEEDGTEQGPERNGTGWESSQGGRESSGSHPTPL